MPVRWSVMKFYIYNLPKFALVEYDGWFYKVTIFNALGNEENAHIGENLDNILRLIDWPV